MIWQKKLALHDAANGGTNSRANGAKERLSQEELNRRREKLRELQQVGRVLVDELILDQAVRLLEPVPRKTAISWCFDGWSETYDRDMWQHHLAIGRLLNGILQVQRTPHFSESPVFGPNVVDFSIGTGAIEAYMALYLPEEVISEMRVAGYDISPNMLKIAKTKRLCEFLKTIEAQAKTRDVDTGSTLSSASWRIYNLHDKCFDMCTAERDAIATNFFNKITVEHGDILTLDFTKGSKVDTVISSQTMVFLPPVSKKSLLQKAVDSLVDGGALILIDEEPHRFSAGGNSVYQRILFGDYGFCYPFSLSDLRNIYVGSFNELKVEAQVRLPIDGEHDMYLLVIRKRPKTIASRDVATCTLLSAITELQKVPPWSSDPIFPPNGRVSEVAGVSTGSDVCLNTLKSLGLVGPSPSAYRSYRTKKRRLTANIPSQTREHDTILLNQAARILGHDINNYARMFASIGLDKHVVALEEWQAPYEQSSGITKERFTTYMRRCGFNPIAEFRVQLSETRAMYAMVFSTAPPFSLAGTGDRHLYPDDLFVR